MLSRQSFLRKGVSLGYAGSIQDLNDLKDGVPHLSRWGADTAQPPKHPSIDRCAGLAWTTVLASNSVNGLQGLVEIGILLPNNQRQHRTLHIQKDVLPCALC